MILQSVTFKVDCVPVGQPRVKATTRGGFTSVYTPTKTSTGKSNGIAEFKAAIKVAALQARDAPPFTGPVVISVDFVFPRPSLMIWKKKPMPRVWHTKKPDIDNAFKAAADAISKILFVDDAQICDQRARKYIASGDEEPHVSVTVIEISEEIQ